MPAEFPDQQPGLNYLTEGGQETEIMYKYGFDLPHFAMFPLLDNPRAMTELHGMYGRYLDTAARHGFGVIVGGLDYRASPDWGSLLGYSSEALADLQLRAIDFLRDVARPYEGQVPALKIAGIVGPRGDAYETNHTITADEAQDYHSEQLTTLAEAGVDLVQAMTFNGVPEVIGLSRAAAQIGLPLAVLFTLDHSTSRLNSGPSVKDAIETIDAETGDDSAGVLRHQLFAPVRVHACHRTGLVVRAGACATAQRRDDGQDFAVHAGAPGDGRPALHSVNSSAVSRGRYPHLDVFGGCCGTWETHLDEIARNVSTVRA